MLLEACEHHRSLLVMSLLRVIYVKHGRGARQTIGTVVHLRLPLSLTTFFRMFGGGCLFDAILVCRLLLRSSLYFHLRRKHEIVAGRLPPTVIVLGRAYIIGEKLFGSPAGTFFVALG